MISILHAIRRAGNIAAHKLETYESDKCKNVKNFIKTLAFFNQ